MTMCVTNTPLEDHREAMGLWVKREDMCCPGGPNFSKSRGVFAHVQSRQETVIGVLDTSHSQGGWAVARACQMLGKQCVNFFPVRKADHFRTDLFNDHPQWAAARDLGATMTALRAGRSSVLYHRARRDLAEEHSPSYMMPNALKLHESVVETALEVERTWAGCPGLSDTDTVIVSASSGTIAAGMWRGLFAAGFDGQVIIHMGYSRPQSAVYRYMVKMAWGERPPLHGAAELVFVDEGYAYADKARPVREGTVLLPPFQCNEHYDLKALSWWLREGRSRYGEALLWNIG